MFLTFRTVFSATYNFPQSKMSVKCPFITNVVLGKVEKENHIRILWKNEERKVKNIEKIPFRDTPAPQPLEKAIVASSMTI